MTKLSSEALEAVMLECLFHDGEDNSSAVLVEGLVHKYGFHPERVKAAKPKIDALLAELPEPFNHDRGGGWSFLNACNDRHGDMWTGLHRDMEGLVCLGIAVGSASWQMRNMVDVLPGGVPYFEIHPGIEVQS